MQFLVFIAALGLAAASPLDISQFLPDDHDCGHAHHGTHIAEYIVGGTEAHPNSWPWMVMLFYNGRHTCGGTIVRSRSGEKVIITAAHCVEGQMGQARSWTAYLGLHRQSEINHQNVHPHSISSIVSHPDYNSNTISNDIAIMFMTEQPHRQEHVEAACIARSMYPANENSFVTGWGTTSEGGSTSDALLEVQKPILSQAACSNYLGSSFIPQTMLCAGLSQGGADACQGDSGGPLVTRRHESGGTGQRWYLTGVVSWGYGCARPGLPGVYAHVYEYVTSGWLRAVADI